MAVGVLEEAGVDLHLPPEDGLERLGHLVPAGDLVVADGELAVLGDDPQLLLAGEGLLPQPPGGLTRRRARRSRSMTHHTSGIRITWKG
jgi:hypothetical protein